MAVGLPRYIFSAAMMGRKLQVRWRAEHVEGEEEERDEVRWSREKKAERELVWVGRLHGGGSTNTSWWEWCESTCG